MSARPTWLETHEREVFSDLTSARFRNSLFLWCGFERLTDTVFERCSLQGCVLAPMTVADLAGVTVTMDCFVFDDLRLNEVAFDTILGLLCRSQGNEEKKRRLLELIPQERRLELDELARRSLQGPVLAARHLADVRRQRFRHTTFRDCQLDCITNAVFDHCRFENCRFEPRCFADILGVTLTLDANTFDGMWLSELFFDGILTLLCRASGNDEKKAVIGSLVKPGHWAQLEQLEAVAQCFGWSAPQVQALPDWLLAGVAPGEMPHAV